ncbi:4107_t:CDS:2, partial [Funneliformis geosporum]
ISITLKYVDNMTGERDLQLLPSSHQNDDEIYGNILDENFCDHSTNAKFFSKYHKGNKKFSTTFSNSKKIEYYISTTFLENKNEDLKELLKYFEIAAIANN